MTTLKFELMHVPHKNVINSFSTLLHPHQQNLDFIPNSSHHITPFEENSSVASESSIICVKTQNACNMESMRSFEFSLNYNEWATCIDAR